jgi:hypothetical protein
MSMATMQMAQRAEQCCSYCDASPARNGSIYTWPEALGLHHCEACCNWEIVNAHPGYFVALAKDNESASGNIGAVDAWLGTGRGRVAHRAWLVVNGKRAPKGNAKGIDLGKDNGTSKGKVTSRSRSPHLIANIAQ